MLLPTEPPVSTQFGESQIVPEIVPPVIAYGYALRSIVALTNHVTAPLFSWKHAVPLVARIDVIAPRSSPSAPFAVTPACPGAGPGTFDSADCCDSAAASRHAGSTDMTKQHGSSFFIEDIIFIPSTWVIHWPTGRLARTARR